MATRGAAVALREGVPHPRDRLVEAKDRGSGAREAAAAIGRRRWYDFRGRSSAGAGGGGGGEEDDF